MYYWDYTAGAVVCVDDNDAIMPLSVIESLDLVTVRMLEPLPVKASEPVSVQGRLRKHSSFWLHDLEAPSFVRNIVLHGYCIPFIALPWPVFKCNHQSALGHSEFVSSAIDDLVDTGCVISTDSCPKVCSPLSVVQNAKGKLRLVLDLRYVNQFIPQMKFKYEGLNLVPQLFEKGDYSVLYYI